MSKVIIYTTPVCGYCKKAKSFFKENKVEYEEKDVTTDPIALEEMRQKSSGGTSVPVIDVNGNIVLGFDQNKLSELLQIN